MAVKDARKELFDLLETKVFQPLLAARPNGYDDEDRSRLEDVQSRTRITRGIYQGYESAEDLCAAFRADLGSEAVAHATRECRRLGLPTFEDLRPEVEQLAEAAGLDPSNGPEVDRKPPTGSAVFRGYGDT